MSAILERIRRELGVDVAEALASLPAADLSSLLLDLAAKRAASRSPSDLLAQYSADRFVRPGKCDPRLLNRVEACALASVPDGYDALTLAPLMPLATCSAVATASQNKIVTTFRNTEVISDASNALALECATRRRREPHGPDVSLCASARMTRAQALERPEFTAHFQLFVTVRAGRDPGGRAFEKHALLDALVTQHRFLDRLAAEGFAVGERRVTLSPDAVHTPVAEHVAAELAKSHPSHAVAIDGARLARTPYYRGVCFSLWLKHARTGQDFPLGDGGLTDWVAKLAGSRKERYLVGAMGLELIASQFAPG